MIDNSLEFMDPAEEHAFYLDIYFIFYEYLYVSAKFSLNDASFLLISDDFFYSASFLAVSLLLTTEFHLA